MSDMAYIMETQDPHELWLVDGENKFKVSRDMYWLLASEGADLPPKHHITELLNENAKLRELCKDMMAFVEDDDACEHCGHDAECVEAADDELVLPYEDRCLMLDLFADRMRELGVVVDDGQA